jgi:hypothetical protein
MTTQTETPQIQTTNTATPTLNQEILKQAQEYFNMGLTVAPFILVWNKEKQKHDKKPDVPKWEHWKTQPQTQEEFDALHVENYSMFGVLCGTQILVNGEKVHFACIDRDVKDPNLPEETKQKSYQAILKMKVTQHEKTRTGGDHLPYFSRKPVKGHKPPNTGMEFLGVGNWCVMAPSEGYNVVNDNSITTVDDAETMFYEALEKTGLYTKKCIDVSTAQTLNFKNQTTPRPCIIEALKQQLTDGNGHLMRLAIAAEYKRLGLSTQQIIELFRGQKDFNPEICSTQIESADPSMTANCQSIAEYGYCLENCTWKKQVTAQKNTEETIILAHLNDVENPELSGTPITVEAVVSSGSISYTVPAEITAIIKEDENKETTEDTKTIQLNDSVNLQFIAVTTEQQENRLKKLFKGKVIALDIIKSRAVYMIRVRPPIQTLTQQGEKTIDDKGREYKYLDIFVATDKPLAFQPSALIKITALPLPHPRTQKTTLLAYKISFPETIEAFSIEKLNQLKAKFNDKTVKQRWQWILDNCELYTHIIGRRNIAAATLLIYFTPQQVELCGDPQHGWGILDIIGDSTVGKSETVKKILTKLLKAGMFTSAENASMVGLTGTNSQTENGTWIIEWGLLVLMDRKLLALDGCHKLSSGEWAIIAETERNGIMQINKAAKGAAPARTRQIRIFNAKDKEADGYTTKPLREFLYPIQALATVQDKTSIARCDIAVFADSRDVTPEQINQEITKFPEPELDLLSEALRWTWTNTAKVIWTQDATNYLLAKATELYHRFGYDKIPLVSPDMKWKLARLSVSAAYLTLSTDDYTQVTITKDHVELIYEFLQDEYTKAGLSTLAQTEKIEKLTVEDVQEMLTRIEVALTKEPLNQLQILAILEHIMQSGGTTGDQLKIKFDLTENNQRRPLMAILQTEGLTKNNRGIYPTTKLIDVYKTTNNFNACNARNTPKNDTPTPLILLNEKVKNKTVNEYEKIDNSIVKKKEVVGGYINFSPVTDVTNVKTSSRVCGDCGRFHLPQL